MSRAAWTCAAAGAAGCALWLALAWAGASVMPGYLAAWLFCLGIPTGALALVLAHDALGVAADPVLRRLVLLLPAAAVLAVPVLLRADLLLRRAGVESLPAGWVAPGPLAWRTVASLVVLSALALAAARAPRGAPRGARGWAAPALAADLCLVSLAALDWVLGVQPGLGSALIGLLVVVAQAGLAASVAALVAALRTRRDARLPPGSGTLLAVLVAVWLFLHLVQYLTAWSANLPAEAAWFLARQAGAGVPLLGFAAITAALAIALLPSPLARLPVVLASLAAMLLLTHLTEALWLVTPAFRGTVTLRAGDLAALLGLGGLLGALLLATLPKAGHAPA